MREFVLKIAALLAAMFVKDSFAAYINSTCNTPDGYEGTCINVRDCSPIVRLLNMDSLNPWDITFIRNSECGKRVYGNVFVCCRVLNLLPDTIPCNTPDGYEGICKNVHDCPEIVRTPFTSERNSECDKSVGEDIFECCRYQENNLLPDTKYCGQQFENRIFGGTDAHIGEFPWVANLEYTKRGGKKDYKTCAGNLINNRYVLTAAHCVNSPEWKEPRITGVRLGEWNIDTDPDCEISRNGAKTCADPHLDVGIETITIHPDYIGKYYTDFYPNIKSEGLRILNYNDLALIRLDRNIQFTDFIRPICLPVRPYQRSKIYDGVAMQVVGWGLTETGQRSSVKKKLTVPGVKIERCRQKYLIKRARIESPQMCAGGEQGKDACLGDSGGSLMTKESVGNRDVYVLAGIVSSGPQVCGNEGFPGIYTRIGPYVEWIESVLKP